MWWVFPLVPAMLLIIVSWQPGRTRDCMIIEDKANSYIATKEALKKHELFDIGYAV